MPASVCVTVSSPSGTGIRSSHNTVNVAKEKQLLGPLSTNVNRYRDFGAGRLDVSGFDVQHRGSRGIDASKWLQNPARGIGELLGGESGNEPPGQQQRGRGRRRDQRGPDGCGRFKFRLLQGGAVLLQRRGNQFGFAACIRKLNRVDQPILDAARR